ncbi:MAG: hypothetical protein KGL35_09175, partial [Bradyrhizobium sp.]|nr:hypothetical protein [Bradyrhizobium sp.]
MGDAIQRDAVVETISGPCEGGCGKTIVRAATGTTFDRVPFWCDECIERTDRERKAWTAAADFRRRVSASGLPAVHHRELDDLEHPETVKAACRAWADGKIGGLLLTGPIGVGKTTLAGAAA